ncbi:hypothetical protein LK536_04850 [Lachnoclostridium pacaense]|uniref:hypothetical protein n=1 Tax=Enterocloster hominis (ex Hitch et al. 2024) TaxID=1917870 RepID=UPI001D11F305|nr:hypothetical protein [Lachnoclostridium pacaense]MCC2875597.1 hypothetical protein [Lachnoclostridium pacaense]
MPLDMVLTGLNYIGQISIRKRLRGGGIDYLGGGLAQSCIKRFGNNDVKESYVFDGILIIFVD